MPHTAIVKVGQLLYSLHLVVLLGMIEPARTHGNITLGSRPLISVGMSVLQFPVFRITRIHFSGTQERPVRGSGKAAFIAYPAASRASIRKDNGLWLEFGQHLINTGIIVIRFTVNRTALFRSSVPAVASVGAVKPHLKDLTVIGHQFVQLLMEVFHVFRRSIVGLMPVPRRKINSELYTILLACFGKITYDISFSIFVRCVSDTIFSQSRRPQAEAVMVLCRQDNPLHARRHKSFHPLLAVQPGRVKSCGIRITVTPLTVIKSVQSEMYESVCLHLLPFHLFLFWNRENRFRSIH